MMPVPADAPAPPTKHFKLDLPTGTWVYKNAAGDELGRVLRFDTSDGKIFLPATFCRHSSHGRAEWRWKSWAPPRPLFGLDRLGARPKTPVLIVEGEKCVDAAAELLPGWIAVTSPNGAAGASKADWMALAQRSVVIWPDHDAAGERYAGDVAKALGAIGVVDIKIIAPPRGGRARMGCPRCLDRKLDIGAGARVG